MNNEPIPKGITLNALRAFLKVAESGGFWPAAKGEAGMAANLKNQVKRLSIGLEVPLTQAQGRGIVLTARGRELQQVATQVLQLLSDFQVSCKNERQLVRIGGGQSPFDAWFVPRWPQLQERLGEYRFQFHNLRTADTIAQLREQKIDFGLVRHNATVDGLDTAALGTLRFALYVPKQLMKDATKPGLTGLPRELPMATIAGDGEFRRKLDAFAKRHRKQFRYVIECTSQVQTRTFLETGAVAAVLPDSNSLKRPGILRFSVDETDDFHRKTLLAWLPARLQAMSELERAKETILRILGDQK